MKAAIIGSLGLRMHDCVRHERPPQAQTKDPPWVSPAHINAIESPKASPLSHEGEAGRSVWSVRHESAETDRSVRAGEGQKNASDVIRG
jgi:hypothetical protein